MDIKALWNLTYGVYVISTIDLDNGGRATGCIANSAMQVTYDTVAVSINHENYTNQCIKKSKKFAISILGQNADDNIIPVFGFQSGREVDKFRGIETKNINGLSVIADSTGYIICDVDDILETETHTVFLGKINDCGRLKDEPVMTYEYYHRVKKGKSPKTAPTYIEETPEHTELAYKCTVCGYVYKGDLTKEPDDYLCPICKQPKSVFVKL